MTGYEQEKEENVKTSGLRNHAYDEITNGTKKYREEELLGVLLAFFPLLPGL